MTRPIVAAALFCAVTAFAQAKKPAAKCPECPPVVACPEPPPAPPKVRKLHVPMNGTNDEWIDVGVKLAPGDHVMIEATGKVKIGNFGGEVTAAGASPSNPIGQLRYKIGSGEAVGLTSTKTFAFVDASSSGGSLKLKIHDTNYDDNAGAFDVWVVVVPGPLIPTAAELIQQ